MNLQLNISNQHVSCDVKERCFSLMLPNRRFHKNDLIVRAKSSDIGDDLLCVQLRLSEHINMLNQIPLC